MSFYELITRVFDALRQRKSASNTSQPTIPNTVSKPINSDNPIKQEPDINEKIDKGPK
jgi:hypothetical protein